MIIKPSNDGQIIEVIRYKEKEYLRYWEDGEFKIDNIDKQINSVGDVQCSTDSMLRVWDQIDFLSMDDDESKVDGSSEDFKENSETLHYWIVDGFEYIEK